MKYKINKIYNKIINHLLNVYNWILYYVFNITNGFYKIPTNYNLIRLDDFTNMSINEFDNKYIRRQFWGDYHDAQLHQWYDPTAVELTLNGLELSITNNTKDVTSYQVNGIQMTNQLTKTIPFGVGLVTSIDSFGYGVFEWNVILPKGKYLWPAIWMFADNSWPPESDIFEGYTNKNGKYKKKLTSNVHCGSNNTNHYTVGECCHGYYIDDTKLFNIKFDWKETHFKIYYNNFLVRVLYNKIDLEWFKNKKMNNIMNNAIVYKESENILEEMNISPLIIKDFKYYAK